MNRLLVFFLCLAAGCSTVRTNTTMESRALKEPAPAVQALALGAVQPQIVGKEPDIVKIKIETTLGDIYGELYPKEAPKTVENFVRLAKQGFYNGIVFHRVIPGFMIQTGDPTGTGTGGPGYKFEDEFSARLRHDKAGAFSMANSGPNTNGSQFFITTAETPWLDDHHSVFGWVTEGLDVVNQIANVPRDGRDKPVQTVSMQSVTVLED